MAFLLSGRIAMQNIILALYELPQSPRMACYIHFLADRGQMPIKQTLKQVTLCQTLGIYPQ